MYINEELAIRVVLSLRDGAGGGKGGGVRGGRGGYKVELRHVPKKVLR